MSSHAQAGSDVASNVWQEEAPELKSQMNRNQRRRWLIIGLRVLVLVSALGLWQLLSGPKRQDPSFLFDSYYFSRPSDVVDALQRWAESGVLLNGFLTTMKVTLIGLALGLFFGALVGFILGINKMLSSVLNPFISALYSIPRLALIPLLLLWFGLGMGAKLALVFILVFFLVFYSTYSGVREVDSQLVDVLKVMGASRFQIYRKVVAQSAMVWIIAGLRIAVPYALVGAVTSEMLVGDEGMGYLVLRSASQFYTEGVYASIVVMMAMAMILTLGVTLIERRALHWKQ